MTSLMQRFSPGVYKKVRPTSVSFEIGYLARRVLERNARIIEMIISEPRSSIYEFHSVDSCSDAVSLETEMARIK